MAFKEDLQKLSIQVNERKVHISNEEMTKQALIIPFLQVLGFDVFNPLEVQPEYTADFGKKKGERVDYALFKDNIPVVFIEAKSVDENLSKHDAQLSRYFNAVPEVKLAILTNGTEYRFFTDLDTDNVMDENAFFKIDITDLKESDIETLTKFKKESFNSKCLIKYAEELVYASFLNNSLKELFKNPNDEFIRFLIKDFSTSRITSNVIDRFRPIVKKAISKAVLDIVSKGLYQEELDSIEETTATVSEVKTNNIEDKDNKENKSPKKQIITTEDELNSYEIVKNILEKSGENIEEVNYKDTTNYFSIYVKNTTKWFVRTNLDAAKQHIMTKLDVEVAKDLCPDFEVDQAPKGIGESRIYINSFEDIKKLENLMICCFEDVNK